MYLTERFQMVIFHQQKVWILSIFCQENIWMVFFIKKLEIEPVKFYTHVCPDSHNTIYVKTLEEFHKKSLRVSVSEMEDSLHWDVLFQ